MTITWPRRADGTSKQFREFTDADMAAMNLESASPDAIERATDLANTEYAEGRITLATHGAVMAAGHPVMLCQAIREAARG